MPSRPNILFLMTDHARALALTKASGCRTPNLDALAADGRIFRRCYTTNAICSPARASLMTGLYPSTHGVWDCTHTQRPEWVDVRCGRDQFFSTRLAEAGYRTGYFGKWHVEQSQRLGDFGWQEFDLGCSHAPMKLDPASRILVPKAGYRDYLFGGVDNSPQAPAHPAFDRGIDFLQRCASDRTQPFCCFVSTDEPHDSYVPPRAFQDLYDPATIPLSPTLHDEPDGKPDVVRRMRQEWLGVTDEQWRRITIAYHAVVSYLDHEVGRIVQALKANGQYDHTIIVFTSDHGDMLGSHGLITKGVGTAYEEVYNIPLVMRVPGAPTGADDASHFVSLADLAPTLLDLCGASPLPQAQGRTLRPVLEGTAKDDEWQDAYAEFYGQRFVYTQRITWHGNWKYIFSPAGIDELYDLASDPHERVNLAADPQHRATLEAMCVRMWRRMRELGDTSLFESHYATLRTAPVGPYAADA